MPSLENGFCFICGGGGAKLLMGSGTCPLLLRTCPLSFKQVPGLTVGGKICSGLAIRLD